MLNIVRIITAAAILTGWCHLAPAHAAFSASPTRVVYAVGSASSAETTCPLRAWPYVG